MAVRVFVVKHFGVTHHPPPPPDFIVHFHIPPRWLFQPGPGGEKMSTRGFRFSKIHTSLLYLTGNYMEMWHNGEQASGATIAVGATKLRAAALPVRVSSHLPRLPSSPPLSSALFSSRSLARSPPSHFTGTKRYVRARILMLCRSEFAHTTPNTGLSL